ncbi:hypothetical protein COCMIDRAFT_32893 [Bipolaris oryzae ATCC 44560]|uniref:Uncharacterized protein n=1 Tax=Bipolaris oryzae ATCC 44560 TaxID=930090 RepID=W6ZD20_COCMI|nr:uncharacterized protein COCMIDRAFT_32893 [Bipolaris oryzae ATCC 44560]EUC49667.1 hypothetical protein COCMIDRAFT_32893 [Bipolaris oryzae ATCC 44560]
MTTRGGGFVGRGGMGAQGRIQRIKTHVLPFTDHTAKEALVIFEGRETCPLPPLYSFAMYFTHKDVNAESLQPAELLDAIRRGTPLQNYPCSFRLEIYFLPAPSEDAASDEACMAHYREEKRSRGDYTRQIDAVEAPGSSTASSTGGLPGFVPSYINDPYGDFYHSRLYNYQGPNWRTDKQPVRRVFFDPIPQEQYAPIAEEAGEPEVLPPVNVTLHMMQESDAEDSGANFLGLTMYDTAYIKTENETNGAWQEAVERGWSTW